MAEKSKSGKKTVKRKVVKEPTKLTPALHKKIIELIADGETFLSISEMPRMPSQRAMRYWVANGAMDDASKPLKRFFEEYNKALHMRTDKWFEMAWHEAHNREMDTLFGDKGETPNNAAVSRSKLIVDTAIRMAAVTAPRKYAPVNRNAMTDTDGEDVQALGFISFCGDRKIEHG